MTTKPNTDTSTASAAKPTSKAAQPFTPDWPSIHAVRRCLLWSGTDNPELDGLIDIACEMAGVVSLPMPAMQMLMATRESVRLAVEEHHNGRA
jgi:hypothetical protein